MKYSNTTLTVSSLILLACALTSVPQMVQAQQADNAAPTVPGSEVFLTSVSGFSSQPDLGEPVNISTSKGYDSQPSFSMDSEQVYYTHFDGEQMDIFLYDVSQKTTAAFQETYESEYSPTQLKNDPNSISVIKVERDGDQHIYTMNQQGGEQRYSELKQVGYHAWHGPLLWTFVINETQGDLYASMPDQEAQKVYSNIGRTLTVDESTGHLYFVDKNTTPWSIKRINDSKSEPEHVINLPEGVEDFARDSLGRFWLGQGNRLYISQEEGAGQSWKPIYEVKLSGYTGITRIAISPDNQHLAFVLNEI